MHCVWRQWSTWAVVTAVLAVIAGIEQGLLFPGLNKNKGYEGPTIIPWKGIDLKEVTKRRKPVVITGSPVSEWEAARWTPSILSNKIGILGNVKQNDSPVFEYFNEEKPMAALKGSQAAPRFRVLDMKVESFFRTIEQNGPPFHYFSADLNSFPSLLEDIPEQELNQFKVSDKGLVLNLWLGGKGVIAETHVDTSHNFYFQIVGKKRFVLFPPTQVHQLGFHPFLHPAYRRSRIKVRNQSDFSLDMDLLNRLGALVVDLEPGQVLYLPPYWFHNVEAMETSISMNIWTDSEEYDTSEAIFTAPVPFEEDWSKEKLATALVTYLDMLLNEFPSIREQTIKSLKERFKQLPGVDGKSIGQRIESCKSDPTFGKSLKRGIDIIAPLFSKLPQGVQEMYMGNFIEVLTHYVYGVDLVPAFIFQCL